MELQWDARQQKRNRLDELRAIRDDIRLDLHLATKDLTDEWRDIERKLPAAGEARDQLEGAATEALDRLAVELRRFRDRLQRVG
jgi:hypothetical protein